VAAAPAVGVHNDFTPGQPRIAMRTANFKLAGRVDVNDHVFRVVQALGHHRFDDMPDDLAAELFLLRFSVPFGGVLSREHDGVNANGFVAVVFHCHLALGVRTQALNDVLLPHQRLPFHQPVGQVDRKGHVLGCLAAGETEHQPLVASTLTIDAHGDVLALAVNGADHAAALSVEAHARVGVADLPQGLAHGVLDPLQRLDRLAGVNGDLAGDDHKARRAKRFAGHTGVGVRGEQAVEHRIGDLVGDLVRVPHGD